MSRLSKKARKYKKPWSKKKKAITAVLGIVAAGAGLSPTVAVQVSALIDALFAFF